jgi:hypothetical protein
VLTLTGINANRTLINMEASLSASHRAGVCLSPLAVEFRFLAMLHLGDHENFFAQHVDDLHSHGGIASRSGEGVAAGDEIGLLLG